jgi:hypothetical protein
MPRSDTAATLGTSVQTVIRLEQAGTLTSVKLGGSPSSKGYNIIAEVERLARGEVRP